MSGYSTRSRQDKFRHLRQIQFALAGGFDRNARTNTDVTFDGEVHNIATFAGPMHIATGNMVFTHYGTKVLAVDFDNDRATDFGYRYYSMTSTRNILEWFSALQRMDFYNMTSLALRVCVPNWTMVSRKNAKGKNPLEAPMSVGEALRVKYFMTAPWVKKDDKGFPWFHGRLYDDIAVFNAERVMLDIMSRGAWHWFTASWINGVWTKHFIDDDAQKRFTLRKGVRTLAKSI